MRHKSFHHDIRICHDSRPLWMSCTFPWNKRLCLSCQISSLRSKPMRMTRNTSLDCRIIPQLVCTTLRQKPTNKQVNRRVLHFLVVYFKCQCRLLTHTANFVSGAWVVFSFFIVEVFILVVIALDVNQRWDNSLIREAQGALGTLGK